ncbi:MAG: ribbon-helix-helix domain-containing protein [Acidimicrobiia bacterium]
MCGYTYGLDDELVQELDRRAGKGRRSAFLAALIRRGLDHERRWDDIEAGFGVIPESDHEWDAEPAGWVRNQGSPNRKQAG